MDEDTNRDLASDREAARADRIRLTDDALRSGTPDDQDRAGGAHLKKDEPE